MTWVSRSYLETKITINTIALILSGVIIAASIWAAFMLGNATVS